MSKGSKSIFLVILFALFNGFSITAVSAEDTAAVTPEQALALLKDGNLRYIQGIAKHPKSDPAARLRTAVEGQKPIASILGCADARSPVETTFDKAFGDLFVVRVAGNVCYMAELASIEFGVNYLKTPLVVVIGHTKCGAVAAAVSGQSLLGTLPKLIEEIQPAVTSARHKHPKLEGGELVEESIKENVWLSVENLFKGSDLVAQAAARKQILVVGAVRDLKSGKVEWLGQHPDEARLLAGK